MNQLIRFILAIYLLSISSMSWAQESPEPSAPQSEIAPPTTETSPAQSPLQSEAPPPETETAPQTTPEEQAPAKPEASSSETGAAPQTTPEEQAPAQSEAPSSEAGAAPQTTPEAQAPAQSETPSSETGAAPQTTPEEQAPAQAQPQAAPPETEAAPGKTGAEKALQATEEEKQQTISTAIEQAGSIIKGRLELELNENYVHSSSNQLFIEGFGILPILVVGNVEVQKVRRDSFVTTFVTRYKITNNLQAEVRVPYTYTLIRISTPSGITGRSTSSSNVDELSRGYGLGDVSGSLSYHFLNETLLRPSIYLGMGFKARTGRDLFETDDPATNPPTGSGFNSVSMSVNAVKTSDPAVVYGSLGYAYAISRNNVVYNNPGQLQPPIKIDFDPGDSFSLGFGMAYALNYKLTLSTSYNQTINNPTYIDGKKLASSATNAITLAFGVTWKYTEKTNISITVSPGLTTDAPDLQLLVRVPYRF